MKITFDDLSRKEVINVSDGKRLGLIEDLELNPCDGRIISIIVPGPSRCLGLLRAERDYCIPWGRIVKIGDDVVLVELDRTSKGE